jgi:hypothetical protein
MKRKQPWLAWLCESDPAIAAAWMEAWWLEARSAAGTDRLPREMRREIEALHLALIHMAAEDPARALGVAFAVAREAEHPGMVADICAGLLADVTAADPTLWDAVALEASTNRRLLHAVGLIWGAATPAALRDAFRRLAGADGSVVARGGAGVESPTPGAAGPSAP